MIYSRTYDRIIPDDKSKSVKGEHMTCILKKMGNETSAFAIALDNKVIGSIGVFRQGNIHRQTAELGYYIAEEHWGKGIMTDAVKI